jgi:hypothetical protein
MSVWHWTIVLGYLASVTVPFIKIFPRADIPRLARHSWNHTACPIRLPVDARLQALAVGREDRPRPETAPSFSPSSSTGRTRRVSATTDSRHGWRVVANLARGMVLTGLDQLWVADITYIRLQEEFAFLAIVLDAFSRRVVGWALDTHLQASLAIAALTMALAARRPEPGSLIHHSDRGVQGEFNRLSQHQVIGGFDGRSQTCIRSMHPKKVVLTRTPVCLAT